jgi:hypothetical protein
MAEVLLFHLPTPCAVQVTSYILPICLQVAPSTMMPMRSIL